jgi:hypothetical protein
MTHCKEDEMLEKLDGLPAGVTGMSAKGKVSKEDFDAVVLPMLDIAKKGGQRLRLLFELGAAFEGFTPSGAWEELRIGARAVAVLEGCAIVSDVPRIAESTRLIGFLMPCPVKVFRITEGVPAAAAWLQSLPEGPGVSFRVLPESGVIVVEVKEALRARDFETLTIAADTWIERHHGLPGLVVHARAFPGWENIAAFLRHAWFIRNHHRAIERVALAVDGKAGRAISEVAQHFVHAKVKAFPYDDIETAISWAAGERGVASEPRPEARPAARSMG